MLPRRSSGELYTALGVNKSATKEDIRKAYKSKALECHPDRAGPEGAEHFKLISEAHTLLMDDDSRAIYDTFGRAGVKHMGNNSFSAAAAKVAAFSPEVNLAVSFAVLAFFSCVLTFLGLVAEKVDHHVAQWTWSNTVFLPVWIIDAFVLFLIVVEVIRVIPLEQRRFRSILGVFEGLAAVAVSILVAKSLDGAISWTRSFWSVWVFLSMYLTRTASVLSPEAHMREMQKIGLDAEVHEEEIRKQYPRYVAGAIFNAACPVAFIILLYADITAVMSFNYFIVFSPLFLMLAVPFIFMQLIACKEGKTLCGVLGNMFAVLVIFSLGISQVVLLALKCENDRTGNIDRYPSMGTTLVPMFVVFGTAGVGAFFNFLGATCSFFRRRSGAEEAEDLYATV